MGTAGLMVEGCIVQVILRIVAFFSNRNPFLSIPIQKLQAPHSRTYIGSGKVLEIMDMLNATGVRTLVFDDDLSAKQQRNLEDSFAACGGPGVKILDRTGATLR